MRPRSLQVSGWAACVLLLLSLLCPREALAQEPPSKVSVLTMGPGAHPFTRFGHNALLLEWRSGESIVYNYGTFEFNGWQGVQDFMAGRFRYWLSVASLPGTIDAYRSEARALTAQELELTAPERAQLAADLADNATPEHRYYDYDYYRDNCSTRVRDVLDHVLGSELKRSVAGSGRLSFRQHTLRLVSDAPWLYFGLDIALGAPTDRPTAHWDELFLPQELHDALARATRTTADGKRLPLVRTEYHVLDAARPAAAQDPPARRMLFGECGAALGLLLGALGWGAAGRRGVRVLFGLTTALAGGALGLLGVALTIFSCSKHWAAHWNRSLLAVPPWALALLVLGVAVVFDKPWGKRGLRFVLGSCVVCSAALLLLALPESGRESLRMAGLFLPLWGGWFWGARQADAGASAPTS